MTATELAIVPPTDTLSFSLTEETVVMSDTVRIVVRVHAQKVRDDTEAALHADIRQIVRSFVDAPDWMLSSVRRERRGSGRREPWAKGTPQKGVTARADTFQPDCRHQRSNGSATGDGAPSA